MPVYVCLYVRGSYFPYRLLYICACVRKWEGVVELRLFVDVAVSLLALIVVNLRKRCKDQMAGMERGDRRR